MDIFGDCSFSRSLTTTVLSAGSPISMAGSEFNKSNSNFSGRVAQMSKLGVSLLLNITSPTSGPTSATFTFNSSNMTVVLPNLVAGVYRVKLEGYATTTSQIMWFPTVSECGGNPTWSGGVTAYTQGTSYGVTVSVILGTGGSGSATINDRELS